MPPEGMSTLELPVLFGDQQTIAVTFDAAGRARSIEGLPLYDCDWHDVAANHPAFSEARPFNFSGEALRDVCQVLYSIFDVHVGLEPEFKQRILDSLVIANEDVVCQLCGPGSSGCASPDGNYLVIRDPDIVRYLRTLLHEPGHTAVTFDAPFSQTIGDHQLHFISYEIAVDDPNAYLPFAPEVIAEVLSLTSLHWLFDNQVTPVLGENFNQSGYMNRLVRLFGENPLSPADQEKFDAFYEKFYGGMNYLGETGKGFTFVKLWHNKQIAEALRIFSEAFSQSHSPVEATPEDGLAQLLDLDTSLQYFFNLTGPSPEASCE